MPLGRDCIVMVLKLYTFSYWPGEMGNIKAPVARMPMVYDNILKIVANKEASFDGNVKRCFILTFE